VRKARLRLAAENHEPAPGADWPATLPGAGRRPPEGDLEATWEATWKAAAAYGTGLPCERMV